MHINMNTDSFYIDAVRPLKFIGGRHEEKAYGKDNDLPYNGDCGNYPRIHPVFQNRILSK